MVKAHEEKLRALSEMNEKKNSEILKLRKEVSALENESNLITQYQEFISDYLVKSQEEKNIMKCNYEKKIKQLQKEVNELKKSSKAFE